MRITKATWKSRLLTIEATSSNPNAILSVFSSAGNFMFDLTNKGGGRFADQRGFIDNPRQISVRSSFGGSASATLKNQRRVRRHRGLRVACAGGGRSAPHFDNEPARAGPAASPVVEKRASALRRAASASERSVETSVSKPPRRLRKEDAATVAETISEYLGY